MNFILGEVDARGVECARFVIFIEQHEFERAVGNIGHAIAVAFAPFAVRGHGDRGGLGDYGGHSDCGG